MNTQAMTPDHLELVRYDQLGVGDVLVSFTPIGSDIVIPPTQRQLRLSRTRWTLVETIDHGQTPARIDILDLNAQLGDQLRSTALPTAVVWRVRPSAIELLMEV